MGLIGLVIMFVSRIMVIEMSKLAQSLYWQQNIYGNLNDLVKFFQKMVQLIGLGITVREI